MINAHGHVTFGATINAERGGGDAIILHADGQSQILALYGQPAPGTEPGVVFAFTGVDQPFLNWVFNDLDQVLFLGNLGGPGVDSSNSKGFWRSGPDGMHYVARQGDHAGGFPSGVVFASLSTTGFTAQPRLGDQGASAFVGKLVGSGIGPANDGGLWSWTERGQESLFQYGDPAPDAPGKFLLLWTPRINGRGDIIFAAKNQVGLLEADGLWFGQSRDFAPIVVAGDQAPGLDIGVSFAWLSNNPLLAEDGTVAFDAWLAGPGVTTTNDATVWTYRDGQLKLVAREGIPAPDLPGGLSLAHFNLLTLNSSGQVVIKGIMSGSDLTAANNTALWAQTMSGLKLVVRAGEPAPGSPTGVLFGAFSPFDSNATAAYNACGQVLFSAVVTELGSAFAGGVWGWSPSQGLISVAPPEGEILLEGGATQVIRGAALTAIQSTTAGGASENLVDDGRFVISVSITGKIHGVFAGKLPSPADLDADDDVDGFDLAMLLAAWGACTIDDCPADLDASNDVGGGDVAMLLSCWSPT